MFLAFKLSDIVTVPFGWLMNLLYDVTANYGIAMIIFAILVKLILVPITAKSKKTSMKMSRLSPRLQEIQKKYANDQQKQSEAMQALYKEEGVSMAGGCLWGFVPLLILLPLYAVVREPITYMLGQTAEVAAQIVAIIKEAGAELFSSNTYYDQIVAASHIPEFVEEIKAAIPGISANALQGVNFYFFGIDLGATPTFNIFAESWGWDWSHIGALLIPLMSAGSQILSVWIMQKMNNSVVTDKNGVQDEETAKNSQAAQSNKMMMWMMPLMSLWIGFTVPCALSLYWLVQGLVSIVIDVILTKRYRKIYDAEDAIRLQKALEREREEAERERVRAERRAANPEGQTQNTSKKKLQQKQRAEEAAAKAAAAKEYAAKKGILEEEEEETKTLSGIPSRPYCKGRAYDPNRYASSDTEE
ncbi:MAG: YidC/Oxa1 family membrane protein insertase [Oscillospiraceae bacterium]|nr:YidC/Oxa1 family membrane protein insertase [Oscillospiraceae bacterium]